jgi:hypothetical protein
MRFKVFLALLLFLTAVVTAAAQDSTKRNDRPQASPSAQPRPESPQVTSDAKRYTWEFTQRNFIVGHIVIEHDAQGRGTITFERKNEEVPIVEPVELSTAALGRIFGLWTDLHFLDSDENYQSPKDFAHLGTYRISLQDGQRKRTAEFNWSNNKSAANLANEYRRVADQAILIFNLNLAREMQPLNVPSLLNEMESLQSRAGLSDPKQLVPLLTELKTDEHIPLIARNQAERILKKIGK